MSSTDSINFAHAFLEEEGNCNLRHEEALLRSEFIRRGIPVSLYTSKRIKRRQLPLNGSTFIAGDMDAMHGAMAQLGIDIPVPNDYPTCLEPWLHRRVWRSTLGDVESELLDGGGRPVFVKPADRRKAFTGRVFASAQELQFFASSSRRQGVWCSEVVQWLSEYRVYVKGEAILAIDQYGGDPVHRLCADTVQRALTAYRSSGKAPAAYGINFGVLSTGKTALIEANDGYALGAYHIDPASYTDLLLTRWSELLRTAKVA